LKIRAWAEDLLTSNEGPLDSARAKITIAEGTDSTTFTIRVTGMDPSAAGTVLGAHLHTGPCIEGEGTAAGPHYNQQVVVGGKSFAEAEISPNTEVWFDLVADEEGMAYDETTVPFVPVDPDGIMSVVVHVTSTNTDPC
jgi:hypothetical protein